MTYTEQQLDTLTGVFQRALAASQSVRVALERVLEAAPHHDAPPADAFDYIHLPRRERRALDLLASRPGRWFSTDQVVAAVWSMDEKWPEFPNTTLWSHMSKMRKRCRAYGVNVEARRHMGYRLVL